MADATAVRFCARCGQHKKLSAFYETPSTSPCKRCENARQREHYRPWLEYVQAIKLERGCADCGYRDHPEALELDHRPGTVKVEKIANLVRRRVAFDVLDAEIAKCDVVCANCHRVRTHARNQARFEGSVPETDAVEVVAPFEQLRIDG